MIFNDKEILDQLQSIDRKLNIIISSLKNEKLKSIIEKGEKKDV